jgi:regulation of enolase protein 1 (concanavalin A-like superfamily)
MRMGNNSQWQSALVLLLVLGAIAFYWVGKRPPNPIPDPAAVATVASWGDAIDSDPAPERKCEFSVEGEALLIKLPGILRDLSIQHGVYNAPRVARSLSGDFVVSVRVAGSLEPGPKNTSPYALPYNGAGLFVSADSNNYLRFERAAILREGQKVNYVNLERWSNGRAQSSLPTAVADTPLYLRLERKGDRLLPAFSTDGEKWVPLPEQPSPAGNPLTVGVHAINTSDQPFTARFESLKTSR